MFRRLAALRLLLAAAAITTLAACASPTAPSTSRLRTGTDTTCRSGFTSGNGFHC
jgi:hypothetical protein